jgi:hypothetical protein
VSLDETWCVTSTQSGSHRMMSSEVTTSTGSKPSLLHAVKQRRIHSASALRGRFGNAFWTATRIDFLS